MVPGQSAGANLQEDIKSLIPPAVLAALDKADFVCDYSQQYASSLEFHERGIDAREVSVSVSHEPSQSRLFYAIFIDGEIFDCSCEVGPLFRELSGEVLKSA